MRWLPLLLVLLFLPLLSGCPVSTAYKDSRARDAKLTDAQKTCWDLPREKVFEGAKLAMESYRVHKVNIADATKGYIETHVNNEPAPVGFPDRRHRIIVQLVAEKTCTRIAVTAPIEEYSKKNGWEFLDTNEQAEGILRDASLKIHAQLKGMK